MENQVIMSFYVSRMHFQIEAEKHLLDGGFISKRAIDLNNRLRMCYYKREVGTVKTDRERLR